MIELKPDLRAAGRLDAFTAFRRYCVSHRANNFDPYTPAHCLHRGNKRGRCEFVECPMMKALP